MPNPTARTFVATLNAAEAARLVRDSYPNAATLAFTAGNPWDRPPIALRDVLDRDGAVIWSRSDEHSDQLARQEDIQARLLDACQADPNCPLLEWRPYSARLDIEAALHRVA